jgi:hypothetical protein
MTTFAWHWKICFCPVGGEASELRQAYRHDRGRHEFAKTVGETGSRIRRSVQPPLLSVAPAEIEKLWGASRSTHFFSRCTQ